LIAPLRSTDPEPTEAGWQLRRARRLVLAVLLKYAPERAEEGPPVSAWRAWLFAGWVAAVTGIYFAVMLGWLRLP
jgi:hypothetical protein